MKAAPSRPQPLPERTRQETEAAARRYAALDWKVIALHGVRRDGSCTCGHTEQPDRSCECGDPACKSKHGASSTGKHPRLKGWQTTPADLPALIELINAKPPGEVNIGIQTGAASGLWVLDVDPDKGGDESLAALEREHGEMPPTVLQHTGSGGRHFCFEYLEGLGNSPGRLRRFGPGLDVRGEGGFIVVWPSISALGAYRWILPPWETSK